MDPRQLEIGGFVIQVVHCVSNADLTRMKQETQGVVATPRAYAVTIAFRSHFELSAEFRVSLFEQ